jgi:hypothetical protein
MKPNAFFAKGTYFWWIRMRDKKAVGNWLPNTNAENFLRCLRERDENGL